MLKIEIREILGKFNYNNGQINRNGGIFKQSNDNFGFRLGTVFFPNDKTQWGLKGITINVMFFMMILAI